MPKHEHLLPPAKLVLTIMIVAAYTVALTTLIASLPKTNHGLLPPGVGRARAAS